MNSKFGKAKFEAEVAAQRENKVTDIPDEIKPEQINLKFKESGADGPLEDLEA